MGNPLHYSLELPQRCLQLIEELWSQAEKTVQRDRPDLGPLTTTFLISMSMPIINLPIERIERRRAAKEQGYADDSHKNKQLTDAVLKAFNGQLKNAPFFLAKAWAFVEITRAPFFNIANSLPDDLVPRIIDPRNVA